MEEILFQGDLTVRYPVIFFLQRILSLDETGSDLRFVQQTYPIEKYKKRSYSHHPLLTCYFLFVLNLRRIVYYFVNPSGTPLLIDQMNLNIAETAEKASEQSKQHVHSQLHQFGSVTSSKQITISILYSLQSFNYYILLLL